ncbi:ATP-binding cassette domain-containing protein [Microbacterium sp. NPDC089189]|uniref:ABC transporter ATP-binding protein n=1 Tax=Microbacterium sp. NPDC089189 TaxID=3154972 RepID=UPI003432EED5
MPDGQVLEFSDVRKRFGGVDAVDGLTTTIRPGVVTGFLGPNGAGKTTSLRILLGLVSPTSGHARIGGVPYAELRDPLRTVGAALEASSFHPGRSAANHLSVYARAAGIDRSRVDAVLGLVGLADVAGRKVGGFSLGMRQRLGLATALLGDPGVLVLDEPSNGLDPEGIKWMRTLLGAFAAEGRTVLVSSHLLAEIQQTADRLLILAHGRLVFEGAIEDLADPEEYATIVDAPDRAALIDALAQAGFGSTVLRSGLTVPGAEPVQVGAIAAAAGIALSGLQRRGPALEEIFLALVDGTRVHPPVVAPTATPADGADAAPGADAASTADAAPGADAVSVADAAPGADAASGDVAHDAPATALITVDDAHPDAADAAVVAAAVAVGGAALGQAPRDAASSDSAAADSSDAAPAEASAGAIPEAPDESDPLTPDADPAFDIATDTATELTEAPDVEVASGEPAPEGAAEAAAALQDDDAPHPPADAREEGGDR